MKRRGIAILALLLAILMVPVAVMVKPELVVNPTSLRWAAAFFYQRGIQLQWDEFKTEFSSPSFLEKDLRIIARNLCVRSDAATGCVPKALVNVRFHWFKGLLGLGPADVIANDWTIVAAPLAEDEDTKPLSLRDWIKRLETMTLNPATVQINKIRVITAKKSEWSAGSVTFALRQPTPTLWNLNATARNAKGTALKDARATLVVQLVKVATAAQSPWESMHLQLSADLAQSRSVTLTGKILVPKAGTLQFDGKGKLTAPRGVAVDARLDGSSEQGNLTAKFEASSRGLVPHVQRVQTERCTISGVLPHGDAHRLALKAHCPMTLSGFDLPRPLRDKADFPRQVSFTTAISYEMADTRADRFKARGEVTLTPLTSSILEWSGNASGEVEGRTSQLTRSLKGVVDFDFKFLAPRFQRVVVMLRGTTWAIPAPFHVLDGAVTCEANSKVTLGSGQLRMPFDCTTNLTSQTQMAKLVAESEFGWDVKRQKPEFLSNVTLLKTRLQLPYLQLQALPRLGPDKRIILPDMLTTTKTPPLTYRVNVRTTAPLEILTNLARTPVPIDIPGFTLISGQAPEGRIVVRNFDVKAFRRNGIINHIALTFPGGMRPAEIDGLITIRNVDYNIHVTLLGTVEKPRFILASDPPRPESELISSAFFGGSLDELDADTARSVSETRAALADGAINLISMYYLASTPIESVGYNAESGVFRAKVKLAEGTSLTVGSDMRSQQSLGVRKRLGRNWAVETSVQRDLETDEQSERAMIRWARRY